jgi:glycosyltransferase involved in cell wall biosynthesis
MHILLIADGRSPTTRRWIQTVNSFGCQVTLVSTYPCLPVQGVEAEVCLPVAFAAAAGRKGSDASAPAGGRKRLISSFRSLFQAGRHLLGPLTLNYYGPRLRWLVDRIQPDLVHALRIPYEGMLASWTPPGTPVAVSIWGNDLTYHAHGSARMAELTRKTLARADGLLSDAGRDIRLAQAWGFSANKSSLVVPGSGGLHMDEIQALKARAAASSSRFDAMFDPAHPLVINPRGFRPGSVRQDTFFASIPFILQRQPNINFACAAMAGQREALSWIERLHLHGKVTLLPTLPQAELWTLFARAQVTVSVSQHDGTPNSLLEAMAFGAFPIAGDIESVREWITPGVNGLLVEPDKPQALAEAVLLALDHADMRQRAAECNLEITRTRASVEAVREKIRLFYEAVAASGEIPA